MHLGMKIFLYTKFFLSYGKETYTSLFYVERRCFAVLCLFYRDIAGLLEQKVIVVSFFGKSPYSAGGCKAGLIDGFPGRRVFHTSLIDDPDVNQELMVRNVILIISTNKLFVFHAVPYFSAFSFAKCSILFQISASFTLPTVLYFSLFHCPLFSF